MKLRLPAPAYLRSSRAFFLGAFLSAFGIASHGQVATVDASSPPNLVVMYDGGPYIYSPNTPDEPTTLYTDDVLIPSTSSNTTAIEYAALIDAGILEGTAGNLDEQYTAQEPQVITSKPDTYSLTPATTYYTPPASEPPLVATSKIGPYYFDFGPSTSAVAAGYTPVTEATAYSAGLGYGWGDITKVTSVDRKIASDPLGSDFCLPNGTPFYVDLANGTYTVSVLSGDASQKSGMVVRGNGLLELYNMAAPTGKYLTQSFPITISNGRLRLEFFGSVCHVNAITITRVPDDQPHKPTIFVASDSTAAAYTEYQYPLTGWGDRISRFMTSDVVVDDQAKAGRSSKSFIEEGGLDTILNRIRPGDYLFVMMAINDGAKDAPRHTDSSSSFKAYLRVYVNAARSHGATPVFVTSQTKRTYDLWGRFYNSVGAYPQSMRDLGAELNVPVIDLNKMSIDFFTEVGPPATGDMFMYFPAGKWTYWPNGDADYIHLQDTGATALARLVVNGIQQLNLPGIAQYVIGAPFIASQPQSQIVTVGDNASFSVGATGTPPLTYQWFFNGAPIAGATGSSYTVANAQLSNVGDYSVVVTNATGQTLASSPATLTVNANAIFSGRAMGLNASLAGTTTAVADTGPLPGAGGAISNSILSLNQSGLAASVGHAAVVGQADRTRAEASTADFSYNVAGLTVRADFIMAHAIAAWSANGTALSGSSELSNIVINGQPIVITGAANQGIVLPNGRITINEQTRTANSITVIPLHIVIPGVSDIAVSYAQAGFTSLAQPEILGVDYVTGGGWITGTASGATATFGLSAGLNSTGQTWGDLTYSDHGDGMKVKSTAVTTYAPGATVSSRHVEGVAQINGVDGYTFAIYVADNRDSGTPDTFSIRLSNGYQATGQLGGGNIQLHQPGQ